MLIVMVIRCCVYPMIRLLINRELKVITGTYPLQVYEEIEMGPLNKNLKVAIVPPMEKIGDSEYVRMKPVNWRIVP